MSNDRVSYSTLLASQAVDNYLNGNPSPVFDTSSGVASTQGSSVSSYILSVGPAAIQEMMDTWIETDDSAAPEIPSSDPIIAAWLDAIHMAARKRLGYV